MAMSVQTLIPAPMRPPETAADLAHARLQMRLGAYLNRHAGMWQVHPCGVDFVWLIDPNTLDSQLCAAAERRWLPDRTLRIPGTPVEIPLAAVMAG